MSVEHLETRVLLAADLSWHNAALPTDVNRDGTTTARDAAYVINTLNANGSYDVSGESALMFDTSADGKVTPVDVLNIINRLNRAEGEDHHKVQMRIELTEADSDNVITSIDPNTDFTLSVYVQDVTGRTTNNGVFAAYLDVTYTANLVDATGPIGFGDTYNNGKTGSADTDGLIDEAGAFDGFDPLGLEEILLFSVPMRSAGQAGTATFSGDPADTLPANETLLFAGPDEEPGVLPDEIEFVGASLQIGSGGAVPVAVADAYQGTEDESLSVLPGDGLLANDSGNQLTAVLVTPASSGTVNLQADGSFVYTPNENFNGTDSFTYAADEGGVQSAAVTVTLTIDAVNDAPVATGESFTTPAGVTILRLPEVGLLLNDVDVDGDTLTVDLASRVFATNGISNINANGSFSYVPNEGYEGPDSFSYAVTDGELVSNQVTVTLIVGGTSGPVANDDGYVTTMGTTLDVAAATGVLLNDTGTGPLTAVLLDDASNGTVVLNDDGSFRYVPDATFSGTDSFVYRADDGDVLSAPATVTIEVSADSSDAPIAVDDAYTVVEDVPLSVSAEDGVLANDTDPNEDPITAQLVEQPANGTVVLNSDGSFVYTPVEDFNGDDSFTYVAQNQSLTSQMATVIINVTPSMDGPIARDDSYDVIVDQPLVVDAANGFLANDTDADGQTLTVAVIGGQPANGAVEFNADGSFTYTPNAGFIGTDSFIYVATDGFLSSSPATVTLNVLAESEFQVAIRIAATDSQGNELTTIQTGDAFQLRVFVQDTSSLPRNGVFAAYADVTFQQNLAIATGGVIPGLNFSNGAIGDASVPGLIDEAGGFDVVPLGPGEFLLFSVPMQAVGAGTVTFATNPADELPRGDILLSDVAEAIPAEQVIYGATTLTIEGLSRPVANDDAYELISTETLTVSAENGVLSNDLSVGETLSASLVTDAQRGTLELNADGSFEYTPEVDFAGTDSFTYRATSGETSSNTATVTITVGDPSPGSISGSVYFDVNNNGIRESIEHPFGGVMVTLTRHDASGMTDSESMRTDNDGRYSFANLPRGNYTVTQEQPAVVMDGKDTGGGNDTIDISLAPGSNLTDQNFGERGLMPGYIALTLSSSNTTDGAGIGIGPDGETSWYCLDGGWNEFTRVQASITAASVRITATNTSGDLFVSTISRSSSGMKVFGNASKGYFIQLLGPSATYGLRPLAVPAAAAIDAAFANM